MMRPVAYILIMIAAYGIGTILSQRWKITAASLRSMQKIASDMIGALRLAPPEAEELFMNYASETYSPLNEAFKAMSKRLVDGLEPVEKVFSDEILLLKLPLSAQRTDLMLSVGEALSWPDAERVATRLELVEERLRFEADRAEAEAASNGSMAQKLSIVAGVFVILLIL